MEIPSVTFIKGTKRYNTYKDWKLASDGEPIIAIPRQKVQTINIPGMNGVLDVSNSLKIGGGPIFQNREGSFSFYCLDMSFYDTKKWNEYLSKKRKILKEIIEIVHGQFLDVETTGDPGVVYHGRFEVEPYADNNDSPAGKLTINYSLKPDPVKVKDSV